MYVRVYYQKCPDCGSTWNARLSEYDVIRIGREVFVCKCGKEWPTGNTEWSHLPSGKKRSYFFSQAEIGVLLIATIVPALFGYFAGDHGWRSAVFAFGWGLAIGLVIDAVLWCFKMAIVGLSLRRAPYAVADLHGGWPWNW